MYLNEELGKIKKELNTLLEDKETCDESMTSSTKQVLEIIEQAGQVQVDENLLVNVMKFQQLVEEIHNDD